MKKKFCKLRIQEISSSKQGSQAGGMYLQCQVMGTWGITVGAQKIIEACISIPAVGSWRKVISRVSLANQNGKFQVQCETGSK